MNVSKVPPGPSGRLTHIALAFQSARDPLGTFADAVAKYGDFARLRFGPFPFVMLNSPESVKHVLVDNPRNYAKGPTYRKLRCVLGEGLVTSDGDTWTRQRKLAQPAFHRERLTDFVSWMGDAAQVMFARWSTHRPGSVIDIHKEMMRVTLDIVGRTLLGQSLGERADRIAKEMLTVARLTADYIASPLSLPLWVPTPSNVRFNRGKAALDRQVNDIIATRRKEMLEGKVATDRADLLTMLMSARDEDTQETMSDAELLDEVMTIILAGYETTANAMTWTLFLLGKHPDVMKRVEAEVESVLGTRAPTVGDLANMPYTRAAIQESMRVYPPIWGIERQAIADDEIAGYHIPKGMLVGIFPYLLHRHPAYWENPDVFDPERFLSNVERPRYAYLPFGGGRRVCIGNALAMMEAQVLLASIVQRYRFHLVRDHAEVEPAVALRPRHGMPVRLFPR